MKKNLFVLLCVGIFGLQFSNVSANPIPETQKSKLYQVFEPLFWAIGYRELKVHVKDEFTGAPISNALVMFGMEPDVQDANNLKYTDEKGVVSFDGFQLPQGPLTLTVAHANYSRVTVFDSLATQFEVSLTPLAQQKEDKAILSGEFTHWPEMEDYDGVVHAGFVIPFIDIVSMINFSTDKMLAPNTKARIYKDVEVPGNLVIPSQEERFMGFISVYVSKPQYQMPLLKNSTQSLIALAGDLPFSDMAKGIINKHPLPDLLNLFELKQFSMVLNHAMSSENQNLDIPLTYALKSRFDVSVNQSPNDKDIIYISAGAFKDKLDQLFPMDFKVSSRSKSNKSARLKSLAAHNIFPPLQELVMLIAADLPKNSKDSRKKDTALSGVLTRPAQSDQSIYVTAFLDLLDLFQKGNTFSYQKRNTEDYPLQSQMSVSFINLEPKKDEKDEKKELPPTQTWWTVVAPSSLERYKLPTLPNELSTFPTPNANQKLTFAMNVFGFNSKEYTFDYHNLADDIYTKGLTHFSRNELDIQP
ncbi:MAG: hypothetical protein A3B70_03425 [Deltaproteobacteria bacterium RIFCSPHIGHO2_02_FULL_40_11]|nr:MAG: hypothetical protein A3B70_03425 [Deltaproteobacteria bacterium RIFCSPHIGHO2_02_FULL_40_11]